MESMHFMRDMSDLYLKDRFKVYLNRKECGKSIGQWRQSAQNGDAEALFRLALCNKQGLCCGRSMKNYMSMMKESADLGFTEAALSMGLHLISTSETGSDQWSEGLAYLKKAAESGDSQVQARVAIELVLSGDAED